MCIRDSIHAGVFQQAVGDHIGGTLEDLLGGLELLSLIHISVRPVGTVYLGAARGDTVYVEKLFVSRPDRALILSLIHI